MLYQTNDFTTVLKSLVALRLEKTVNPRSRPAGTKAKHRVVTFKVEEDVATFLDGMPNKSEFIRRALLSAFMEPCPVCNGKGSVPRSLRHDLEAVFKQQEFIPCNFCGYEFPLETEKSLDSPIDKVRLAQFLHGGDFYCNDCFSRTQTCDDCGEHVAEPRMLKHKRGHKNGSKRL